MPSKSLTYEFIIIKIENGNDECVKQKTAVGHQLVLTQLENPAPGGVLQLALNRMCMFNEIGRRAKLKKIIYRTKNTRGS